MSRKEAMKFTPLAQRILTGAALAIGFVIIFFYMPPIVFSLSLLLLLGLILIFEWLQLFKPTSRSFWLLPFFYLFIPIYLINMLNIDSLYRWLIPYLFLTVALHDIGSYIVGKLFGTHRIWPTISPNKTWEGFFGGYLITSFAFILILWMQGKTTSFFTLFGWTGAICTIATIGDFFESWLKRRAGIKDTSPLLPGHGGLLDRFDGILFAAVLFYLFREQLSMLLL